jgi:uncharacterized protein (TIGR03083 family)
VQLPQPIIVVDLFPEILDALLELLASLSPEDWHRPTACAGWTVKDVALHLLGGEIGNLSRRRDGHTISADIGGWEELVRFVNDWNQGWVHSARRTSPRLVIDLLRLTGAQMNDYFRSLDPYATGGPVHWVGPHPAPVWLDLAREYTERWHHQQHIRDAAGRPGLKQPRFFAPVLRAFAWALPRALQDTDAAGSACVTLTITGESGGRWSAMHEAGAWRLYEGAPERPQAEAVMDEDVAWRLFTRGLDPSRAQKQILVNGDPALGLSVLGMVSIIA